ncbi:hypothetical protein BC939DRAFT_482079 [Gamsiella multidivaricata]|uniref:uncharacterized protein n=1 Tax=Gamsiella multidivaricata TaxID=101098 RepID=UPI00221EE887|nr:uncharacterized protein BC939DRAFT_482079 [Gamsiella multidivaricata]KAI7816379.1 hypothetical protein BC939DRAFT_482079 [Gamsiella multidivaricata]
MSDNAFRFSDLYFCMFLCILSIVLSPAFFENGPEHPPRLTERRTIKHNATKANIITAVNKTPNSTSSTPAPCAAADADIPPQAATATTDAESSSQAATAPTDTENSSQANIAPPSSLPHRPTAAPPQDDSEFSVHLDELETMLEEENTGAIPTALQIGPQIREYLNNKRTWSLVTQEHADIPSSMSSESRGSTATSLPQSTELSASTPSSSSSPRPFKKVRFSPDTFEPADSSEYRRLSKRQRESSEEAQESRRKRRRMAAINKMLETEPAYRMVHLVNIVTQTSTVIFEPNPKAGARRSSARLREKPSSAISGSPISAITDIPAASTLPTSTAMVPILQRTTHSPILDKDVEMNPVSTEESTVSEGSSAPPTADHTNETKLEPSPPSSPKI